MIIGFEVDDDGNFLDPLSSQLEKIIRTSYEDMRDEYGIEALQGYANWLQAIVPCKIIIDYDTNKIDSKYFFKIEVEEADYIIFLLKYAENYNDSKN